MNGLLKTARDTVVPVIVSAVISVGFVAFAGKVVLWVRFRALEVPQDQVVAAVPQSEAVAVGASILLIFGFFGALATLGAYLVDRGGRATPGMVRALLALATLESVVAVVMVTGASPGDRVLAALLVVITGCAAFAVTFKRGKRGFVRFEDTNRSRKGEELRPRLGGGVELGPDGRPRVSGRRLLAIGAPTIAAVAIAVALLVFDLSTLIVLIGIVVILALMAAVWVSAGDARVAIEKGMDKGVDREESDFDNWEAQRGREADQKDKDEARVESERLKRRRPYRLKFNLRGTVVLSLLALAGVLLPSLALGSAWLAVMLGSVAVIGFGLWRIAGLSKPGFVWFGLAMLLSVPLFGMLTLMFRDLSDPQVQPMALIRNTDGPDQAIQGLYVTETDGRVYFANVATEGCSKSIQSQSGRLLWVPKDEVVAISIGPLQDVEDAGNSALEMSYALTPSVETPAAGAISLTTPEKRSKKVEEAEEAREVKEAEERAPHLDQRLDNPGPAVRPDFGTGLKLVPEVASPGEEVELRLRVANLRVNGFGARPNGHALRLNGTPLSVLREWTRYADRAEYVKTEENKLLSLDKKGVYGLDEEGKPYVLGHDENQDYEGRRFVKLDEGSGFAIHGSGGLKGSPRYLQVHGDRKAARLVGKPIVQLEDGHEVGLRPGLLRQAWENDAIRFRVPENASSGVVTVECEQLAGQPLLRVSRAPTARIGVQMRAGSGRITFNSDRSSDEDGDIQSRRWRIGGLRRGHKANASVGLPSRFGVYSVELTVTDDEGWTDTAKLQVMRVPSSRFARGKTKSDDKTIKAVRRALTKAAKGEAIEIELHGHASSLNRSLKRDEELLSLLSASEPKAAKASTTTSGPAMPALDRGVQVKELAYGDSCPIYPRPGSPGRSHRVDIFVLSQGVTVKLAKGCHVGRVKANRWRLPSPKEGESASGDEPGKGANGSASP